MRIGINIPVISSEPLTIGLKAMAVTAETSGADSLWVGDHLTMVDLDTHAYPYTLDGSPRWDIETDIFEALSCCSFLAALTERVTIGTAVLVLPQRNVLEVAKTTATIDALSGGRLVLGMGAGWFPEEFESLGYTFKDRGRRMNEMIPVLRDCWTGRPRAFAGEHVTVVENLVMHPLPASPGGPPLLLGGNSPAALRRATQLGDGWMATTDTNTFDLKYGALSEAIDTARGMRAELGQADVPFRYAVKLNVATEPETQIALVLRLRELGFDEVVIDLHWKRGMDHISQTIGDLRGAVGR